MIQRVNGDPIFGVDPLYGIMNQFTDVQTPYECCARCFATPDCGGSVYTAFDTTCLLLLDGGVCDASQTIAGFRSQAIDPFMPGTLSNGPCGQMVRTPVRF